MKALRLHRVGDLRLHDEATPAPDSGEVLLRVTAVGVCGSDLHWLSEAGIGDAQLREPLILGHEFVGVVEASDQSELIGKRVVGAINIGCSECDFCLMEKQNHCINRRALGLRNKAGAFAEYLTLPSENLVDDTLHPDYSCISRSHD